MIIIIIIIRVKNLLHLTEIKKSCHFKFVNADLKEKKINSTQKLAYLTTNNLLYNNNNKIKYKSDLLLLFIFSFYHNFFLFRTYNYYLHF